MLLYISFCCRLCDTFRQNSRRRNVLSPLLCAFLYLFLQNNGFILYILLNPVFFFFHCFIFLLRVTRCLTMPFCLFSTYWTSSLSISLAGIHSTRRPCQEDDTVFTLCLFVRESMHRCLSICTVCTSLCVCIHMWRSAPFPSAGYVQGQQLCCQDVFKSFLQEHLLCFLSAG